mmetsp:Transcript_35462/g.101251  ORF Transcript_35462/g.101251 Transcript_35462/m.101251 type:complete len:226 (-) Transcript_35462:216-893(-)
MRQRTCECLMQAGRQGRPWPPPGLQMRRAVDALAPLGALQINPRAGRAGLGPSSRHHGPALRAEPAAPATLASSDRTSWSVPQAAACVRAASSRESPSLQLWSQASMAARRAAGYARSSHVLAKSGATAPCRLATTAQTSARAPLAAASAVSAATASDCIGGDELQASMSARGCRPATGTPSSPADGCARLQSPREHVSAHGLSIPSKCRSACLKMQPKATASPR